MMTRCEAVKEGALIGEHTTAVRGEVLAQPWVPHVALAVLAGEVVAGGDGVELVALTPKLTVTLLVVLAYDGHFDFLASSFSETV